MTSELSFTSVQTACAHCLAVDAGQPIRIQHAVFATDWLEADALSRCNPKATLIHDPFDIRLWRSSSIIGLNGSFRSFFLFDFCVCDIAILCDLHSF